MNHNTSNRRSFVLGGLGGLAAALLAGCTTSVELEGHPPPRRRVRHRAHYRRVHDHHCVVVPGHVCRDDEIEFDDGRCGTVLEVQTDSIVIAFGGRREIHSVVFEGEFRGG